MVFDLVDLLLLLELLIGYLCESKSLLDLVLIFEKLTDLDVELDDPVYVLWPVQNKAAPQSIYATYEVLHYELTE